MQYLINSCRALSEFVDDSSGGVEVIRIARAVTALYCTGIQSDNLRNSVGVLIRTQSNDGGWVDPEETAWVAGLFSRIEGANELNYSKAIEWLDASRLSGRTWGKHARDRARIPTTALVLTLVPEAGRDQDYHWVAQEWAKDLSGSVQLSYKAGFYLLVAGHESIREDSQLIGRTLSHLVNDQNDDGGFAPWRNHPIGSDPWSTGVVLWGLSKWVDQVKPAVIEKALHWLEVTQLPSGYWPYHYLDEGTSYALIGAVSAMRAMASRK